MWSFSNYCENLQPLVTTGQKHSLMVIAGESYKNLINVTLKKNQFSLSLSLCLIYRIKTFIHKHQVCSCVFLWWTCWKIHSIRQISNNTSNSNKIDPLTICALIKLPWQEEVNQYFCFCTLSEIFVWIFEIS